MFPKCGWGSNQQFYTQPDVQASICEGRGLTFLDRPNILGINKKYIFISYALPRNYRKLCSAKTREDAGRLPLGRKSIITRACSSRRPFTHIPDPVSTASPPMSPSWEPTVHHSLVSQNE